jgi:hypothetical protein
MKKTGSIVVALVLGVVLVGCTGNAEQGLETADTARDLAAQNDLQTASVVASNFFATSGSYEGFTAATAKGLEPAIHWVDGGPATVHQVSIRGADASGVALVTKAESGNILCIGQTAGGQTQGNTDAESAADCTGSW